MTPGITSPRRLRIALIITELEVGGAEQCMANLATGLDRQRFEPIVYSLAPRPSSGQDALVKQLEAAEVPLRFVGARSAWSAWATVRTLRKLLAEHQPVLVQSFLFHANVLGTLAAVQAGVRNIVMGIRVADPSKWRQVVERWCARRAKRVVCVSQSVADRVSWIAALPTDKLSVIPNGIDAARFAQPPTADLKSFGISSDRRVAVAVGRLHKQKGMDWLLDAAPQLFNQVPDLDLLIVGTGPEESRLISLAASLPDDARVHFVGWRTDVPAILKSCDLFLLPSRWEGMANALLESMAIGLPVVASRVEGVEELLGASSGPQTVEFGDTQALVDRVVGILNDPRRAEELGSCNRQRALSKYSLEQMVQSYQDLYETLAKSHE